MRDEKIDKWFLFNKDKGEIEIKLNILKSQEDAQARMNNAYYEWKGGNAFGQRFLIGTMYTKIGNTIYDIISSVCNRFDICILRLLYYPNIK